MHRFEELKVWQNSIQLAKEVYLISIKLPKDERFGLISQIQRSAVSVASNIAEGAGRNNNGEFIHFIGIANGSACELYTQIVIIKELTLIVDYNPEKILDKIKQIQNMLFKLKQTLKESSSKS